MSDPTNTETETPEVTEPSELDLLKQRAKVMGVQHSPNIGVEALKKKIEAKLEGENPSDPVMAATVAAGAAPAPAVKADKITPAIALAMTDEEVRALSPTKMKQALRHRIHAEEMKLVRCQIYNNNPSKSDLGGEIISVGNKYLGNVKKFIPFGEATEPGYHIPNILYKNLLRRKYQQVKSVKQNDGTEKVSTRMVPEYTVVVLDPLTEDELKELALKQSAAERVGL